MDTENKSIKVFKNLRWIVNEIYLQDKKYIIISILTIVINGSLPPLSLIIMQEIINLIQTVQDYNKIVFFITAYVLLNLFQSIYSDIVGYYNTKFSLIFDLNFSENIYIKAAKLSLKDYENSNTYDLLNRAQYEGGGKLISYYGSFMSILTQIITLISYIFILIKFKIWIVAIVIIMPILRFLISNKYNIIRYKIYRDRTNDSRKSWYWGYLLTYGNFYKELKTFNLFNFFIDKYKSYIHKFNEQDLNISKSQVFVNGLLDILETILEGIIFSCTVFMGINGYILIGNIITYTRSVINSKSSFTSILLNISSLMKDSLYIDQLFEYFSMTEENNRGKISIDYINSIKLEDVNYKYPNSKEYILKNINLEIKTNKKIAILGLNGSGKTTLIKLMMGFYNDYEGNIFINGIDLRYINKDSLLNNISTLFQDFIKYEATIRENIAYSNLNLMNNDRELYLIAKRFNFTNIVKKYGKGLDMQLGLWFDEGVNLSMGQWQKIALARAFAKKASLYILDEPNAAMDLITEYEISQLYEDLLTDKMGIIIAHRFNNIIKSVDEIVILDKGKIIEKGDHFKLMNLKGLYYNLFKLNSNKY